MAGPEPHGDRRPAGEPARWLDRPANVTKVFRALIAVCAALLVADFLYHKHSHLEYENWPLFFPLFGFAAYLAIVYGAKVLRRLVMREEDYYE